jgi:hypothetical protein
LFSVLLARRGPCVRLDNWLDETAPRNVSKLLSHIDRRFFGTIRCGSFDRSHDARFQWQDLPLLFWRGRWQTQFQWHFATFQMNHPVHHGCYVRITALVGKSKLIHIHCEEHKRLERQISHTENFMNVTKIRNVGAQSSLIDITYPDNPNNLLSANSDWNRTNFATLRTRSIIFARTRFWRRSKALKISFQTAPAHWINFAT